MDSTHPILKRIITFLESIDIFIVEKELGDKTFLPGLTLHKNTIQVDFKKLKYPGDILHEAGHIATTEKEVRHLIGTDLSISYRFDLRYLTKQGNRS